MVLPVDRESALWMDVSWGGRGDIGCLFGVVRTKAAIQDWQSCVVSGNLCGFRPCQDRDSDTGGLPGTAANGGAD